MSANRLEQMGAATRDRSTGRWLLPWQIAVYELILTFAVVGSYGLDVWIRGQVLASESRAIAALQVLGDVGNSKWGLVTGGCVVFGALVLRTASIRPARRALYGWIASAAGYVVAAIAISGILTNVFKIIYGRARPRYLAEGETADWSLFAFDWSHQSFPSGHTTTLFAFAVAMCFLLPRFRVWLISFAVVGGLARIAVNAHFLSDVIAGAAMGGFIAWWLRGFLARRNWVFQVRSDGTIKRLPIGRWWLARPAGPASAGPLLPIDGGSRLSRYRRYCLALAFLLAPLALFTPLDRIAAGMFHLQGNEFWLTDSIAGDVFHDILRPTFYWLLIAIALGLTANGFRKRWRRRATARRLFYVLAVFGIGVGLVTNLLLKDQWDRPRPLHTVEFGGEQQYQPALIPTHGCARNCSFVSGDASAAFAMIALPIAFAAGRRRRRLMQAALWFGVAIGLMRMFNGSHYLFDVTYAGLINVWIATALYPVIMRARPGSLRRWGRDSRAAVHDFGEMLGRFWQRCRHG